MALSDYRSVWDTRRERYSKWVDKLAGMHGVYVIRQLDQGGESVTLYVGESHTGRLRETLQRHFQRWNGETAGPTFDRLDVEVAVEIKLDPEEAIQRQNELIHRLSPVHNRQIPTLKRQRDSGLDQLPEDAFEEVANFFEALAAAR